jgi:two-component system invasion response regulator UvrY
MIKIAIVDDHIILRKSLAVLIGMFNDFEIVLQAGNGHDLIEQLDPLHLPDIVLLDITMPGMDGVATAQWLKQNHPGIKVLALSMIRNDQVIIRMLKNGVRGYILKDCEPEILQQALLDVYKKGYYYNELITPIIKNREQQNEFPSLVLSAQEISFIRWACTEKTYKEIADEMNISPRTVDGYRDALFQKLNVSSRVGLALYAIRSQIVQV